MKTQKSIVIQSTLKLVLATLLLLGAAVCSQAEQTNILTATDSSGNSSFNAKGNWLYQVQPGPGTNYFTGAYSIRTPSTSGNYTFLGDSLTISTGGGMTIKGGNANIITMNNLTNSGVINNGINANNIAVIAGNMTVVGAASLHTQSALNDTRGITNNMNLFGSGTLTNLGLGTGPGYVVYRGNNTAFTGPLLVISNTVLQASSQTNLGGNPASFNAAQFVLNNGTLLALASFAMTNAYSGVTINPGGGTFNVGSGLTLTISNPIVATGPLTVSGGGTLALAGSANLTSNVTVSASTLNVTGVPGGLTNYAGTTLQAGNTGTAVTNINGNVTISGTNNIAGFFTTGTETINGNLNLVGGNLAYDLNFGPGASDFIALSGAGCSFTQSGTTVITAVTGLTNGTYILITNFSSSSIVGSFSLATSGVRGTPSAAFNTTATAETMTISGASLASLVWRGTNGTIWDLATTTNWANGAVADKFYSSDSVTFDDTGLAQVSLGATVYPNSVTVSSVNTNYAFSGAGGIGGGTTLTKNNASTLYITNANTFTGGTYIYGGTVEMDSTTALGTGAILDNANLSLNVAGTVANTITGSGTVTKNGSSTTLLSAANTFTGGATINAGVLQLGNATALGTPVGATLVNVASGASLDLDGKLLNTALGSGGGVVSITGTGINATTGALQTSAGMGCDIGCGVIGLKYLQLAGNATIGDSTGDFQLGTDGNANGSSGVGSIDGQGNILTKVGNNNIVMEATNKTALSQFIISSGGVQWANTANNPVGTTCSITISNNAFIDAWDNYQNTGISLANNFTIGVGGARFLNDHGTYFARPCWNTFSGAFTLNGNLTVGGNFYQNGVAGQMNFTGPISGSGGVYNICATNAPLTLSGANTYYGQTVVTNYALTKLSSIQQGGGSYTIYDKGALDVPLQNGYNSVPMSSLTLGSSAGCTLSFGRLIAMPATPVINATTLTVNGICTIIPPVAGYANGVYPLIQYSTIGGTAGSFVLGGSLPRGVTANIVTNSLFGNNYIALNVTGSGDLWTGSIDQTTWDVNNTQNWSTNGPGGLATVYFNGDAVVFDESANPGNSETITLPTNVAPLSVTFNVTNSSYVLGKTDGSCFNLNGSMSLVKNGTGSVLVQNTNNTFTGGTYINNGVLQIGYNQALNYNGGNVYIKDGGTLDDNGVFVPNYQGYGPDGYNVYIQGSGYNGQGAIVNNVNVGGNSGPFPPDVGYITLTGNATIGGSQELDMNGGVSPKLSTQNNAFTLTKIGTGAFRIRRGTVDANFGNFQIVQGSVNYEGSVSGLGNPTNSIIIGTNATLNLVASTVPLNKQIICSNGAIVAGTAGYWTNSIVTGNVTVLPGATAHFNGGNNGSLTIVSPLMLTNCTINGENNPLFAGGLTNLSGTVTMTGSSIIGGPVNIQAGSTLQFNGNYYNTLTFSNVISGSGNFGMQYQSIIVLAASNTFSGNITVPYCNAGGGTHINLIGVGSISHVPSIYLQGISNDPNNMQAYAGYIDASGRTDGTLTLNANQTLRGDNGSQVIGNVEVTSGATLKMVNGQSTTVTGNLQFDAGSTNVMDVYCAGGIVLSNDVVNVGSALTYGGTLVINTNGAAFVGGETFPLFVASGGGSGTLPTIVPASPGPGLAWDTSNLIANGVLGVAMPASPAPVLTNTVSGSQMTLSWPVANLGWQVQSNSMDLSNPSDWYPILGTELGTSYIINIDTTQTNVFYRLNNPNP